MGDFAKGIKTFKAGMKEEDEPETTASPDHLLPPGGAAGSAVPAASVVDGTREPAKNI
jgi:sec-independent protein translocase protein TatA